MTMPRERIAAIDPGPAGVVAQRLRRERARNGWSAGDVVELLTGNRCRMRRGAIKDIEDGKQPIKLNEAVALAQVLGVGLDNLLTPVEDLDNEEAAALANEAIAEIVEATEAEALAIRRMRDAIEALETATHLVPWASENGGDLDVLTQTLRAAAAQWRHGRDAQHLIGRARTALQRRGVEIPADLVREVLLELELV